MTGCGPFYNCVEKQLCALGDRKARSTMKWITSEQITAIYAVSDARKQTTYAFVSWRVRRDPGTIHIPG